MKFSIKGILAVTLLIAVGLHSARRWNHIRAVEDEIKALQVVIAAQSFDPEYVAGHTAVCVQTIEANQLPSTFFTAAVAKHEQITASKSKGGK